MNLIAFLTLEKLIKLEFMSLYRIATVHGRITGTETWIDFCAPLIDYARSALRNASYFVSDSVATFCESVTPSDDAFALELPLISDIPFGHHHYLENPKLRACEPSNINNECYTPDWFIDVIRDFAGNFDLDPFSSDTAQKTVRARHYFTESHDTFGLDWFDHVDADYPVFWINPPYSRDLISKCVNKTLEYVDIAEIYLLVNSSTSSKWYQKCVSVCTAMLFPKKRIQFINPYKDMKSRNEYDQTLFYFGASSYKFQTHLRKVGSVVIKDPFQKG